MKLVNLQTHQFEEVPDDQVQQAYLSGTHGFSAPNERVGVRAADGTLGTIDAKDASQAFQSGAQFAPHAEVRQAELEAKHGGIGGTLAAGAEGLARGATLGLSDKAAVAGARLFGSDESAANVRTHLEEEKEAHPIVSTVGEIGGAALPLVASGGESAAAQGGRMAALLRAVGAPARAVGEAGELGASVASRALELVMRSPGADGAIARVTRAAATTAGRAAAEGAIFGAGNQFSEDTLGDHELNAEKMAAAIGHGALYGAMLGGTLGGTGRAAKETFGAVVNRIAPSLERQADVQMWRALSPLKKFSTEAETRAGGVAAVGRTLRANLNLPDEIMKSGLTAEELGPKVDEAVQKKWIQMRDLMSATGGEVNAGVLYDAVDDVIAPLRKKAGFEGVVNSIEEYRDSLARKLGIGPANEAAAPTADRLARTPDEIATYLREHPETAKQIGPTGILPEEALYHQSPGATKAADWREQSVGVTEVMAQRKALDELAYKESKALDPKLRVGALREIRSKLANLEVDAFDAAAKAAGKDGVGQELRALRKEYQQLRIAQDAVEDTQTRMVTNQNLSLTDKMLGAAHGAGLLAAGHPLLAASGLGVSVASKFVRERGNTIAATALGKLAKLDLIARASDTVDGEIEGALKAYLRGGEGRPPPIRLRHYGTAPSEDIQERYEKSQAKAPAQPSTMAAEHVDRALPGLSTEAPNHAASLAKVMQQSAAYLAAQRPVPTTPPDLLGRPSRISDVAADRYVRVADAVDDPVGTIVRGLESGKIGPDEIAAIKATKPRLYSHIQQMTVAQIGAHGAAAKLPYDRIVTLSKILGVPLDPSLSPQAVIYAQQTYAQQPQIGPQSSAQTPRSPKRKVQGFATDKTLHAGNVGGS